jgi:HSP20 family molecular chaperone IbpA
MSRASLFNNPLILGFDDLERLLTRMSRSQSDGYPPYNIEQLDERRLRISLAVAGFDESDLSVTVEDRELVVRGTQPTAPERQFLHQGIAARQFQRSFALADGLEVSGARLENGLLHIELERPQIEPHVRRVEITSGDGKA